MGKGTIICLVITFIVLGGVAILIAWGVDKMKSPTFTVDEASVSNYNLTSDNRFNATFNVVVRSRNVDSKYTIYYNPISVAVFRNAYSIAAVSKMGPYIQHHGDELVFTAQPIALNYLVRETKLANDLREDNKIGMLRLEVRMKTDVRFKVKGWKRKGYTLGIVCSPVVINLSSGNTFEGTTCDVDRF